MKAISGKHLTYPPNPTEKGTILLILVAIFILLNENNIQMSIHHMESHLYLFIIL